MKIDEKVGTCIKERGNWGKLKSEFRFDHKDFNKQIFLKFLSVASPKLETLLNKIQELDTKDMVEHGRLFKHFIYSDIKSAYGAKLIAAGLSTFGFDHAYKLKSGPRGMSFSLDKSVIGNKKTFATLTSVAFFEKPIGIQFRKELLKTFNSRPDNVHGDQIRIIVLDSGFREGIDLFDVKYVHLFEPIATLSDQKQAIGRATRFCGQKGLRFDPLTGWPIHVFRYQTIVPEDIQRYLLKAKEELAPADTFFNLFMKFSNIDPKKIQFANELEQVVTQVAVDRVFTQNIHQFKIQSVKGGQSVKHGKYFEKFQEAIEKKYRDYTWPPVKIENMCGGASIVSFTPTQDFVRHYFTPKYSNPGMLLYHSIGTGKTCSAIATASSSFEAEDYTILYVTRYTLKGDVWKNMFDQVCNVILQDKIKKGLKLPEAQAARLRLISKGWFEPMSYRQFSNMLAGKNKLYHDLIQRNGTKDPLHKTLIIIDEAHKLFAADVEGQEKADIEVIRNALHHSNEVSKEKGAKLLFMTGTPYTDDPMDMIRLLNLCRPNSDKLPETFETFAEMFLDIEGHFTEEGRLLFLDKLTGYISYLNREKDVRSFSYPVFHEMPVVMSDYEYIPIIDSYLEVKNRYRHYDTAWKYNIHTSAQDVEKLKRELAANLKGLMEERNQLYKDCLTELKAGQTPLLKRAESTYKEEVKKCKQDVKADQKALDVIYKQKISDIKAELKAESKGKPKEEKDELKKKAEEAFDRLKLDKEFDKEQIEKQTDHRQCMDNAFQKYQKELEAIKIPKTKEHCEQMKKDNDVFEQKHREINERIVGRKRVQLDEQLKIDENIVKTLKREYDIVDEQLNTQIKEDLSQRTGLENCLKNIIKPAYRTLLKGDAMLSSLSKEATPLSDSAVDNIFLISGHGNEDVVHFKARWTMPQDKALIVFPVCARANYLDKVCKFVEAFNDKKYLKLFRNPIKYRKQLVKIIDQPMRIYLPGESVPHLTTNLFLDYEKDTTIIVKSGVYRIHNIPEMNRDILRKANKKAEELGSPLCVPLSGVIEHTRNYNSTVHKEVFAGNVYKPAKEGKTFNGLKARSFTIKEILEDMGPGVYYYIGCRSTHFPVRPDAYLSIYEASEKQQEAAKRTKKISPVLKLIRGKEVVSSSSSNKSMEKEPSPTPSPEKPKKIKKEREPDNNKEERKILQDILNEIDVLMNTMENVEERIQEWNQKLEPILKTKRLENVLHKIHVLEELNKYKSTASKKLIVTLENDFYKLMTVSTFKVDNKNYSFQPQLYGYLPNRIDVEEKCSSKLLVNYLKKLLTNNVMIELPKSIEEWETKNFTTVCNKIRDLMRKK